MTEEEILKDDFRVDYFNGYINAMADAYTKDDFDVRGYMACSLMDKYESQSLPLLIFTNIFPLRGAEGFETRFGVTYVDYTGGQKRYPKRRAKAIGDVFESLMS